VESDTAFFDEGADVKEVYADFKAEGKESK
jgi:hypothetical protein